MPNQEPTLQYNEDEIDLKELINTILNNKITIFLITTLFTVLATIYAYTKTPIFESTALIEIGSYKTNTNNINNVILLDDGKKLSKKLNVLHIDMLKNEKNRTSEISSILVVKGLANFIEIKSEAISNDLAVNEILLVVNSIKSKHKIILDDIKQTRELEIANIDVEINNIKYKQIELLNQKIIIHENNILDYNNQLKLINISVKSIESSNPALTALKLIEKRTLSSLIVELNIKLLDMINAKNTLETIRINRLVQKKNIINSMLLEHNYKNTRIVGKIITNDYAIKPKKKLIVIVSFITGLILSIFLVFLFEFIKGFKRQES